MLKFVSAFVDNVLDAERKNIDDAEFGKAVRGLIRLFQQEEGKESGS